MRLGRRLTTGVAEHPPEPAPEPQQQAADDAVVEARPTQRVPVGLATER